jgi:hypothetical protein
MGLEAKIAELKSLVEDKFYLKFTGEGSKKDLRDTESKIDILVSAIKKYPSKKTLKSLQDQGIMRGITNKDTGIFHVSVISEIILNKIFSDGK